jgi:hypothetical protein
MKYKYFFAALIILFNLQLNAQQLTYYPDLVVGHRSYTYLHNINYQINSKFKFNNLTLFDTEYETFKGNRSNIFFLRNLISYSLSQKISLSAAVGIKNPGSFVTASALFRTAKPIYSFAYSIGVTYQKGFTVEQSLNIEYVPPINENYKAYFNLLAIANVNLNEYQRGLQFLRMGVKVNKGIYGLFLNLDQFNNNQRTLENAGVFIKYNF